MVYTFTGPVYIGRSVPLKWLSNVLFPLTRCRKTRVFLFCCRKPAAAGSSFSSNAAALPTGHGRFPTSASRRRLKAPRFGAYFARDYRYLSNSLALFGLTRYWGRPERQTDVRMASRMADKGHLSRKGFVYVHIDERLTISALLQVGLPDCGRKSPRPCCFRRTEDVSRCIPETPRWGYCSGSSA